MLPRIFRQNSIDNFFDDFAFDAPFGIAHRDAKHEWNGLMKMDIRDKDGQYTADIELPGCKKEDIAIELNNGYLTVTANSRYENDEKGDDGKFIRRERFTGQCSRSLFIGEHVKQEDVKAKFENGVLSLTFPKEGEEPSQSKDNRKRNLPKKTQRKGDGLRPSPFVWPYPRRSSGARHHPRKCSVRYSINSSTTPGSFLDFLQIRLILRTVCSSSRR